MGAFRLNRVPKQRAVYKGTRRVEATVQVDRRQHGFKRVGE